MKVKITKISATSNPLHPTPLQEDYKVGIINKDVSLPNEYCIEGYLEHDIVVGENVVVNRTKRNNVECSGLFATSVVTAITHNSFDTLNSKYLVEYLNYV